MAVSASSGRQLAQGGLVLFGLHHAFDPRTTRGRSLGAPHIESPDQPCNLLSPRLRVPGNKVSAIGRDRVRDIKRRLTGQIF
jgi:hypothetical protein